MVQHAGVDGSHVEREQDPHGYPEAASSTQVHEGVLGHQLRRSAKALVG